MPKVYRDNILIYIYIYCLGILHRGGILKVLLLLNLENSHELTPR